MDVEIKYSRHDREYGTDERSTIERNVTWEEVLETVKTLESSEYADNRVISITVI